MVMIAQLIPVLQHKFNNKSNKALCQMRQVAKFFAKPNTSAFIGHANCASSKATFFTFFLSLSENLCFGLHLTGRKFFRPFFMHLSKYIIRKICYNIRMDIWQQLPPNFTVLAPMEGVTDVVFRAVIAKAGAPDLFFTEFTNVSSFASEKGRNNALERLDLEITKNSSAINSATTKNNPVAKNTSNLHRAQNSTPVIAQIWGKNPAHFAETASALEKLGFAGLDINMGCPDRHVNKAGGGAAMIKAPDLAIECIKQAKSATSLPVSVKTRLGFTYLDEYKTWLPLLLERNLAALTVHLRTRKEMSKVPAHYDLIPNIVNLRDEISPHTKFIINGDIKDVKHIQELSRQYPEVDGWMIGRGVFQNPFCFNKNYIDRQPTSTELRELLNYHLDLFDLRKSELESRGSKYAYEPLKHFFKIYINNFPGASELRAKLMECHNTSEVRALLKTTRS